MARAQVGASQDEEEDSDEEDSGGVYETLWDAVSPPAKSSEKKTDTSKFDLTQCHIDDFNLIKVLGKGSFGKVG